LEKPVLYYDDLDNEKIVGNRSGLTTLLHSIETSLENGGATVILNGVELLEIELCENFEEPLQNQSLSFFRKLLGYVLTCCFYLWIVVLPLIGVSVVVHVVFFEEVSQTTKPVPDYLRPLPKVLNETP
jgi:hypothetical protein